MSKNYFIPLSKCKQIFKTKDNEQKLTGYINIKVELKSPLIIPNTSNSNFYKLSKQNPEHKSYGYYSYEDLKEKDEQCGEPIIPGSSIRGCIRSIHEILTDSCLSTIDNRNGKSIKNKGDDRSGNGKNNGAAQRNIVEFSNNSFYEKLKTFKPCDGKSELCPTCSLFGIVSQESNFASASKVRFSDLHLDSSFSNVNKNEHVERITLKSLFSPDSEIYTYYNYNDKNLRKKAKPDKSKGESKNKKIQEIITPKDIYGIKGRKFYPINRTEVDDDSNETIEAHNITVSAIKKLIFIGKIYFNDITITQLETLLQATTLGDDDHYHQIGMGKPLGYGKVNISVNSINLRTLDQNANYNNKIIKREKNYFDINGNKVYLKPKNKGKLYNFTLKNEQEQSDGCKPTNNSQNKNSNKSRKKNNNSSYPYKGKSNSNNKNNK